MTLTLRRHSNRLPYANLLNAVVTTDRIVHRDSRHTAATMLFGAIAIASLAAPAQAVVPFDIRIESEKPGMQTTTATFKTGGAESFDKVKTGAGQKLVTDFGTDGAIKGTYTNLQVNKADQYGGADGKGNYAVTFDAKGFTLDLTTAIGGGVNYFGYWLSALDRGNKVSFSRAGQELFIFNPQDVLDGLAKTGNAKSYYSNPNKSFAGQNSGEPYVFVNFFSNKGGFDQIRFYQDPRGGGYESDNHTVGNYETKGTGTVITVTSAGTVPEPAVWATMIIGLGMVGASNRKRNRAVAF
jgi:hypothetical protein